MDRFSVGEEYHRGQARGGGMNKQPLGIKEGVELLITLFIPAILAGLLGGTLALLLVWLI